MRWIITAFQSLSEEYKRAILLVAIALAAIYALITIVSMVKLTALTMLLFVSAQHLLLLSILCYIVVIIMTRESVAQQHFEAGNVIFHQGETGNQVYVIINGEVEVVQDRPAPGDAVIARLGPGQFFGEMALIRAAPRVATVRALTDLDVLVMQRGAFLSLFTYLPALRQSFQRVMQERAAGIRALARPKG
jgi:hypothetical protein